MAHKSYRSGRRPKYPISPRSTNVAELAAVLHQKYGLPKPLALRIIKTFLRAITDNLRSGQLVRLRNFGSFRMRKSHGALRPKFNASPQMLKVRTLKPGKKKSR